MFGATNEVNATPEGVEMSQEPGHGTGEQTNGIALALGGGAARGWAHIGILRALDEAGVPVKMIAGTSIGALVGGCYLAGKLDELEEFAVSMTPRRVMGLLDISLRGSGLISGYKLAENMAAHLGDIRIENLPSPLVCVSTEIKTGHEIWLTKGCLIDAMRASYALPGIFSPVKVGNRILVDGALVNPVPVSVCRAFEADAVVAVNLSSDVFGRGTVVQDGSADQGSNADNEATKDEDTKHYGNNVALNRLGKTLGVTGALIEAFDIIQDRISRSRLAGDPPDISIRPPVGSIGFAEFHRAGESIQLGYQAAMNEMRRLKGLAAPNPYRL